MRVLRGEAEGVRWELWLREPPAELRGLVAGLWAGDADSPTACHRALPNGELWLMVNLGPAQRVVDPNGSGAAEVVRGAFVMGLCDRPVDVESVDRHPRVVCVRFRPLGAWAFFGGLPMAELANRVYDLDAMLDAAAGVGRLRQRLIDAPDLGTALILLESWLAERLARGRDAHPVTGEALRRLAATPGERVEPLARRLGVTPRHLNALFRREVGLSVKGLARVLRFDRALDCLARPGAELAAVAHQCGYFDQAHLNRDFRQLAGLTPTEYQGRVFQVNGWREVGA